MEKSLNKGKEKVRGWKKEKRIPKEIAGRIKNKKSRVWSKEIRTKMACKQEGRNKIKSRGASERSSQKFLRK
jgi:hypothetical protein